MTENVFVETERSIPRYDKTLKPSRKVPSQFPHRVTFAMASDQVETLQRIKKAFRCSEAFAIRMCFDAFARVNGFVNDGGSNGR